MLFLVLTVASVFSTSFADYRGQLCNGTWANNHTVYMPGDLTVFDCIDHCRSYGYAAMIDSIQCFCSDSIDELFMCKPTNQSVSCCTNTNASPSYCGGDSSMVCGSDGLHWYSIYDAGDKANQVTDCSTTFAQICSSNRPCAWSCNLGEACFNSTPMATVYGTGQYSPTSSFCLAAAHDLRYVLGDVVAVVAQQQYVSLGNAYLEGSWRFGISSSWLSLPFNNSEVFNFTQPSPPFWTYPGPSFFVVVNPKRRQATCLREYSADDNLGIWASWMLTASSLLSDGLTAVANVSLTLSSEEFVYCGLRNVSTSVLYPSTFVPVVMPASNLAQPVPSLTVRSESGTPINITFALDPVLNASSMRVCKQNHCWLPGDLTVFNHSEIHLSIAASSAEMAGFYLLQDEHNITQAAQRLIVVEYNFSKLCEYSGVQREDGACICAPPFGGDNCSHVCPLGYFGHDCSLTCNATSLENCGGFYFCAPDPLGCTCSSGWTGINCDVPCTEGWFGPDCKLLRDCHCAPNDTCRFTGVCPAECAEGFYNAPYCDLRGPSLLAPPFVLALSYDSVKIAWTNWTAVNDSGFTEPHSYLIQYMLPSSAPDWLNGSIVNASESLSFTLVALAPHVVYKFRVFCIFNGTLQPWASPELSVTTPCDAPVALISNLTTTLVGSTVYAHWLVPDNTTWHCDVVNSSVEYHCFSCGNPTVLRDNVAYPQASSQQNLPGLSSCFVEVYMQNVAGNGPSVSSTVFQTIESAPGPVTNVQAFSTGDGLLVLWQSPSEGMLTSYRLTITLKTSMEEVFAMLAAVSPVDLIVNETYYLFSDAVPGATYLVTITSMDSIGNGTTVAVEKTFLGGPSTVTPIPRSSTAGTPNNGDLERAVYWVAIIVLACLALVMFLALLVVFYLWCRKRRNITECDRNSNEFGDQRYHDGDQTRSVHGSYRRRAISSFGTPESTGKKVEAHKEPHKRDEEHSSKESPPRYSRIEKCATCEETKPNV